MLFVPFTHQEVQKDLQTKREGIAEAIRSVEELLAERGDSLSPEEREKLQGALTRLKEQYSALTDSVSTSLLEVDTAISTTVQQNTQKVRRSQQLEVCTSYKHFQMFSVFTSFLSVLAGEG